MSEMDTASKTGMITGISIGGLIVLGLFLWWLFRYIRQRDRDKMNNAMIAKANARGNRSSY